MVMVFSLLVFLLAGMVKGVLGMGLPTVAVGLLAIVVSPGEATALLLIPSLITNFWQLFSGPALLPLIKRLWPMLLALSLGTLLTTPWLVASDSQWASVCLGLCLVAYGVMGLRSWRWRASGKGEATRSTLVGLLTGLITGATGVFVIPAVPYLQALGFDKESLIQALGLSFTVSTIALGIGLLMQGGLQIEGMGLSWLMLVPALIGLEVGQRVRQRLSEQTFRKLFFGGLVVLGLHAILRAGF